jgi:hypothetical protein
VSTISLFAVRSLGSESVLSKTIAGLAGAPMGTVHKLEVYLGMFGNDAIEKWLCEYESYDEDEDEHFVSHYTLVLLRDKIARILDDNANAHDELPDIDYYDDDDEPDWDDEDNQDDDGNPKSPWEFYPEDYFEQLAEAKDFLDKVVTMKDSEWSFNYTV